jgi:hypothetical protein
MARTPLKIGDVIKLKGRFKESGRFGIVIDITKAESLGEGGWISFDYLIMNEKEQLIHITESCVEKIYSKVIIE